MNQGKKDQYKYIRAKVNSQPNGPQYVTPYGFPTVLPHDEEASKEVASKAGPPNQKLLNDFGQVIKHNSFIENETMINIKNPLQYSVIQYHHQMKKNTNQYHEDMFEEKAGDIKRIHANLQGANDKARNTKKLRKDINEQKQKERKHNVGAMFDDPQVKFKRK